MQQQVFVQNLVEVENEAGETQMGVVERLTEKGEVVVRILVNNKILVFTPTFEINLP